MTVGEALRRALAERGWMQKQLAYVIGSTECHVSEIAHGRRDVSAQMALRLEAALGIPAHRWLELQIADDLARADPVDAAAIEERAAQLTKGLASRGEANQNRAAMLVRREG